MSYTTAKEAAKIMRDCLKLNGVNARVRMTPGIKNSIQVFTPTYESRFTPNEIGCICEIALGLDMTFVRQMEIDVEKQKMLTEKTLWEFYL
jgi:hypothetical protein